MRAVVWSVFVIVCGCAGPPMVEVGTGAKYFVPLTNGDVVAITPGQEGGYQLWASVKTTNLRPDHVRLRFTVVRARDEKPFGSRDDEVSLDDGEHAGTAVYLPDPTVVRGVPCTLRADAMDADGRSAASERLIMPE